MRRIPGSEPSQLTPAGVAVAPHMPLHSAADYFQVRDYVRIFMKRRWLFAAVVGAGLLSGFSYNWLATPIYEARAKLIIEGDANVLGLDRPVVDQRVWLRDFQPTQLGILESQSLARRASEDLKRTTTPGMPVATPGEIRRGLSVSPLKESRVVSVGFQSTDPALAVRVANAVAHAYVAESEQVRSTTVNEASTWLTRQVQEQGRLVQESEAALQRYRQAHGADVLGEHKNGERPSIVLQKLGELQEQATRARGETIEKEAQVSQLAALRSSGQPLDTLPAIGSSPFIQNLKSELATQQQQLAQTSEKLGDRHPEIIKLRGAVENAGRKLEAETNKLAAGIHNDRDAARAREGAIAAALERQKVAAQELSGKAVEYTALEREAEANRQQLDTLLQRSREAVLARDVPSANARVLDPAELPWEPISPRKTRNLALAAVSSGMLALALVFGLEIFNNRVTSPDDVTRYLRLPVLGVTPQIKLSEGQGALLLSDDMSPQFAELLHGVRTSLLMTPELATARTLLVTSAQPGEGKTVSAANVAVSLARLNQRVLLIDGDLRRPRLHDVFGVEQRPGLTEVLRGLETQNALRNTKVPRLWLMPSGAPSQRAADLLGSDRFRQLIECLRDQFDWVVVDSPPVLSVTDACLMSRVVAGVLLIVGSGEISRDIARAAVERLDAVGANVMGALLNRADLDNSTESYLPYYHRDYDYYPTKPASYALPETASAAKIGADGNSRTADG